MTAPILDADVPQTAARNIIGAAPTIDLESGVQNYLEWAEQDAR